jgi:hypothetical protein
MRGACAVLSILVALTSASPAGAVLHPYFKTRPTKEAAEASWPAEARRQGVAGWASAVCQVRANRLQDCKVISESPAGMGFGQALLGLAPEFRMYGITSTACAKVFHETVISYYWSMSGVGSPDWARGDPKAFAAAYPKEARARRMFGGVVLECAPTVDGRLRDCRAAHESPQGWGFADAALKLESAMWLRPFDSAQEAPPPRVFFPINFVAPEALATCF